MAAAATMTARPSAGRQDFALDPLSLFSQMIRLAGGIPAWGEEPAFNGPCACGRLSAADGKKTASGISWCYIPL
jgi:hypothetical protein